MFTFSSDVAPQKVFKYGGNHSARCTFVYGNDAAVRSAMLVPLTMLDVVS